MQALSNKKLENKHGLNITQLWLRHSVYWPYFLILLLLSLGAAKLYLLYKAPLYEANARVLIKDENKGSEDSKSLEFLSMVSTKKLLENEKEVLLSKRILLEVVKNLGLYAPIYEKGKFRNTSAYVSSPVLVEAKNPDQIEGSPAIEFTYNEKEGKVFINKKAFPLNQW